MPPIPAASVRADDAVSDSTNVVLGIQGVAKRGYWAQVQVDSTGTGSLSDDWIIHGYDGEGFPVLSELSDATPPNVKYVKVGREAQRLSISASNSAGPGQGTQPISSPTLVSSLQQLVVVVGGDIDLPTAIKLRRRSADETIVAHQLDSPQQLPLHPIGYDAVDALIMCTADASWLDQLTSAQLDAVDRWVRDGGCLVLSVGSSAEQVLGASGKLARFVPGQFAGPGKQRETNAIESYVKAGTAIKLRDELGRIVGVPSVSIGNLRGRVLVAEGAGDQTTPWLVQSAYGLGTVVMMSADLDVGPLAAWIDRPRLVAKILDVVLGFDDQADSERSGQVQHLGFTDLAGQLRTALDQFDGVWLVPFSLIAGLLAAYVLLLGPVDYFLLRQFGGHMHWTWFTFPLIVLGFAGLAGFLAQRVKSDNIKVNQVDLVDIDLASGHVRTHTWAHLYSPTAASYSLELTPADTWQFGPGTTLLSWQGLAGDGFSGLEGQGAVAPIVAPYKNRLRFAANELTTSLENVGVPARSTRSLAGTWTSSAKFADQASLVMAPDGLISGEFNNPLSVPLRDCAIVCDQWYYKVGSLQAGQAFSIASAGRPLNFRYRLMRRVVDQRDDRDFSDMTTPWDRASFDLGRIMEMMMFHKAASGRGYTGLLQQFHGNLDLTDQLEMQVAILFGRLNEPASELKLQLDDTAVQAQTEHWGFCRILFPVTQKR